MALPKIDGPIFHVTVPVLDVKLTLRPYLMKEEKILLLAQQSEDSAQVILAMKQVIGNCIVDGDFDIEQAPNFAIEFLLMQLRKQSVGSNVKVSYEDNEDGEIYDFEVDLDTIELNVDPKHDAAIEITEDIGLLMKYPTLNSVGLMKPDDEIGSTFNIIRSTIDKVFTDDEVIEFNTHSEQEQIDFLEQMSKDQIDKIIQFFDTIPTYKHTLNYTNKKGNERKIELEGISDFFT